MRFRPWLEALYHAHPDVHSLLRRGFTEKTVRLTRDYAACCAAAATLGPAGGVVEAHFAPRKPLHQTEATVKAFVNPEDRCLVPLTGDRRHDMALVARTVAHMKTAREVFDHEGAIHARLHEDRDKPLEAQARKLAQLMFIPTAGPMDAWPEAYQHVNPAFRDGLFATLGPGRWEEWAARGYLDSVWLPGEEVVVFDPRRVRVGAVVHRNAPDDPIPRARRR